MRLRRHTAIASAFLSVALSTIAFAQQPAPPAAAPAARTARPTAQVDVSGYWVAQITEDWRWRMMTPPKGDYMGVPLNPAGRKVGDSWDLAKDTASGDLCKAFGAGGLMRHPT